jgi:tetratricopeptide (TPR) repeat protein
VRPRTQFLIVLVSICVAVGAAVAQVPTPTNNNMISGHITDEHRAPVPDVRVELMNDVNSVLSTIKTDGSGLFIFRRLSDGVYHVRVQTYGTDYVSQTRRVDLARTGFGSANEQLEIVLTTNRAAATSSSAPGAIFVQEVPQAARNEYDKAVGLLQKPEQRKQGMELLKKAIDIFPRYFAALDLLGTEHVKLNEFEAAVPLLIQAAEVNARSFTSNYALAFAQYNLKQLPQAVESARRAVTLNPRSANANLLLGMVLRQVGKLDEAEGYLKQADQLAQSKSPDAHWQLALLFNDLKRFKEAADHLELFLKVQPDSRDSELIKKLIKRLREKSSGQSNFAGNTKS